MLNMETLIGNVVSGIVTGIAGGIGVAYVNHRLSLWRDRRNDFNRAVAPIRDRLNSFHNGRALGLPSDLELQHLDGLNSWRERRRLRAAIEHCRHEYNKQHHDTPDANWGGIHDTDLPAVKRAIDAVLKELVPR